MTNSRKLTVERSTATAHKLSRYDGLCGNVHGHNINWEVEVRLSMDDVGDDNMPLDLKDISGLIDEFDHEMVVAEGDPMLELDPVWGGVKEDADFPIRYTSEVYGPVWVFEGDPTCEVLSQYVADELVKLDPVYEARVTAYETQKYGIEAIAFGHEEFNQLN
jgi:6-pyruvoyl-tetrahydropterin synthase